MSTKDQLSVDTDALRSAGENLQTISNEFGEAGNEAREVASVIGDVGKARDLSKVIRQFADRWDLRREKLKESVDTLATATLEIAQAIEETDKQLGDVLPSSTHESSSGSTHGGAGGKFGD